MANITIYNLHPAGSDFFYDAESYMNEMSEGELNGIHGGAGIPSGILLPIPTPRVTPIVNRRYC